MSLPSIREYLTPQEVSGIYKSAEAEEPKGVAQVPDWKRRAKIVGAGLLGMGLGTLAGFGGMELIDRYHPNPKDFRMKALAAAPILGTGMGVAYKLWKDRENKELQGAVKPRPDNGT